MHPWGLPKEKQKQRPGRSTTPWGIALCDLKTEKTKMKFHKIEKLNKNKKNKKVENYSKFETRQIQKNKCEE